MYAAVQVNYAETTCLTPKIDILLYIHAQKYFQQANRKIKRSDSCPNAEFKPFRQHTSSSSSLFPTSTTIWIGGWCGFSESYYGVLTIFTTYRKVLFITFMTLNFCTAMTISVPFLRLLCLHTHIYSMIVKMLT